MSTTVAELVAKFSADTSGFSRGMDTMSKGLDGFEQMAIGAFRRVGELAVNAVGKAFEQVGNIAKAGIDFNSMQEQAETAFTTMLGSAEKAQSFLNEMQAFAKKTPFEYPDLLVASRRLMALGFTSEEVLPMLGNIGDAVAAMGGNQEMIDRVTTALGQMKAKGKVQAEEMMQLSENGIAGWDMLAKFLNVDVATAMEMVTKRQVDAATGIAAIQAGISERFGGMMQKQSTSWAGMISNLKDSFGMLSGKVMKPLFDRLKGGLQWLVDFTSSDQFTAGVERFTERFAKGLEFLTSAVSRFASDYWVELKILTSENNTFGEKLVAVWDMIYGVGLKLFTSLADSLRKLLPQWLEGLGEWATGIWEWLKEAAPKALEALWEWAKGLWGWLAENLPTWAANLWEWAKATWAWIVEVTPVVVEKMKALGLALVQGITEWAFGMGPEVSALWNIIVNLFTAAYGLITGNWSMFWSNLQNILINFKQGILPTLQAWGESLWQWIVDATPIALTKLGEWLTALGGWLSTNVPRFLTALRTWAVAAWQWIVDAIPDLMTALGQWGAALWQWLVTNGPTWIGTFDTWGRAAWTWLTNALGPIATALGNITTEFVTWKDVVIGSAIAIGLIFGPAIIGALGAVLAPIGAFVAAWAPVLAIFAAAIAAVVLVRNAWERDWGGIQTKTTAALNFLTAAFAPLLDAIKQFGGQALTEIIAWATGNQTNFEAVTKIWEAAKTSFSTVFGAIGDKLVEWGTLAWEWFNDNFPMASKSMITAVESIKTNFKALWDAMQPLIQKLQDAWAKFSADWGVGSDNLTEAMARAQRVLDGIFKIIVTAVSGFVNNVLLTLKFIVQLLDGDWAGAWETAKQIVQNTINGWQTILKTAFSTILSMFGLTIQDVRDWYQKWNGILSDWWQSIVHWIIDRDWYQYGSDIIEGLWEGMKSMWNRFSNWTSNTWEGWVNRFKNIFGIHSPSTVFAEHGMNIVAGLAKGISGAQDMVYGAMGDLSAGMNATMNTDYAYAGTGSTTPNEDATLLRAVVEELRMLRAALAAKNMTANVTVAGGGENIGTLTTYTAMGRG